VSTTFAAIARWPRPLRQTAALLLVVAVGLLDWVTGTEISLSVLYLVPVGFASWLLGRGQARLFAFLSAVTWFAADLSGHVYSSSSIPFWNAIVRLSFFLIVAELLTALRLAQERLELLAKTDQLTGVANGRAFSERLDAEIERSRRYEHPLTIAYMDLDDFKRVNDAGGHDQGDALLRAVAVCLERSTRTTDLVGRLGGDEFAILLPETAADDARTAIDKLHAALSAAAAAGHWPVGFSIGVATFSPPCPSRADVVRAADQLMYEVKRAGKNAVLFAVDPRSR